MASFFPPHPLFLSQYPLARPSSKPTAAPPSQPPTPPSQPPLQPSLRATNSSEKQEPITQNEVEITNKNNYNKKRGGGSTKNVDSTDWVASSLTRRFGLGAGLAWAGFLAVGVLSEQIKTRLEVSQQEANTRDVENEEEVVLPNGIRYYEERVGGGATPRTGDLVVIDLKGSIKDNGEVFVDTFGGEKKPLALVMGSRPYTRGMCEGIEYVLKTMKAGGKRRVIVPSNLGFGDKGADFGSGVEIPPFATLEYVIEVDKVSIAPA